MKSSRIHFSATALLLLRTPRRASEASTGESFSKHAIRSVSTKAHVAALTRLTTACDASSSSKLAPRIAERSESATKKLQMDVFEAMFAPIRSKLDSVPTMTVWKANKADDSALGGPSAYASAVGEQLLMLVQHLEPFSSVIIPCRHGSKLSPIKSRSKEELVCDDTDGCEHDSKGGSAEGDAYRLGFCRL